MENKNSYEVPKKTPRTFRLTNKAITRLKLISKETGVTQTEVIENLLENYYKGNDNETDILVDKISLKFNEKLKEIEKNYLAPVRASTNIIDRNTQMNTEFWNHYFIANQFKNFATTNKVESREINEAKLLIKDRITVLRQKKLEREQK